MELLRGLQVALAEKRKSGDQIALKSASFFPQTTLDIVQFVFRFKSLFGMDTSFILLKLLLLHRDYIQVINVNIYWIST